MKTGGFGINGEKRLAAESLEEALQIDLSLNQANSRLRRVR
jgi:hypothetical protein